MKSRSGEWSVVLFAVGMLAFNPPILSIFSVPDLLFGIPTLCLYIFVVWGVVIALLALNVPRLTEPDDEPALRIPGPVEPARQDDLVASLAEAEEGRGRHDRPVN